MTCTNRTRLQLRLPTDLKAWLAGEALRNGASQNSEIIRSIRERMERATTPSSFPPESRGSAFEATDHACND